MQAGWGGQSDRVGALHAHELRQNEPNGEGGIGGERRWGEELGGKSTLNPRQRQTRRSVRVSTTACEPNYHNDVKEPNQQSGANLSCITGLSFVALRS